MRSRTVCLEGVGNFRDFGGVVTATGGRVRGGCLYRSGSLHEMTAIDRDSLAEVGIQTIVDLRCAWERDQAPIRWPAVSSVAAPLVTEDVVIDVTRRFRDGRITSAELEAWWNLVGVFRAPEEHAGSVRVIVETLLEAEGGVLIHCRGGKDRTGMVVAFVLDALGVGRAAVLVDFLRSNDASQSPTARREIARLLQHGGPGRYTEEAVASLAGVRPAWLERLFADVEGRYGSVVGYLAHRVGVGEDAVEALRRRYVEPPHGAT